MSDSSHRVQIIVAVIGLIGVLGAAVIANWDKIFGPVMQPEPVSIPIGDVSSPASDTELNPIPSVLTARIHFSGAGVAHGFFTSRGNLITMSEIVQDINRVSIVWKIGDESFSSRATAVERATLVPAVSVLILANKPIGKPPTPIRVSNSLSANEAVDRYLGPNDVSPGRVLEKGKEIKVGETTLRNALLTTDFSGPGDAGAPVLDKQGKVVAMVYGAGGGKSISIPIEDIKASFFGEF